MENVKMISPWVNYYKEVKALFQEDPDVEVKFDDANNIIKMYVDGAEKAQALEKLLPMEKSFGNVTVKLEVIPSNSIEDATVPVLFEKAFAGNPAFISAECVSTIFGYFNYVTFDNKVVQYYNDDLGDKYGLRSTLYQEIAKEVFDGVEGAHFCTIPDWMKVVDEYAENE